MRPLFRWILWLSIGITSVLAGQDEPVLDENVKPVYFASLEYPLTARLTKAQGLVVVRVQLDNEGKAIRASALSGPSALRASAVENAKKWRFDTNSPRSVFLVYQFKIEGLCKLPCASQFSFRPPNLATVVMGEPVVDHASER